VGYDPERPLIDTLADGSFEEQLSLLSRDELVRLLLRMARIQAETRQKLEEVLSRLPNRTH
jgi:hypothetical protein